MWLDIRGFLYIIGLQKRCFRDQVWLKPAYSASKTGEHNEFSPETSLDREDLTWVLKIKLVEEKI